MNTALEGKRFPKILINNEHFQLIMNPNQYTKSKRKLWFASKLEMS